MHIQTQAHTHTEKTDLSCTGNQWPLSKSRVYMSLKKVPSSCSSSSSCQHQTHQCHRTQQHPKSPASTIILRSIPPDTQQKSITITTLTTSKVNTNHKPVTANSCKVQSYHYQSTAINILHITVNKHTHTYVYTYI